MELVWLGGIDCLPDCNSIDQLVFHWVLESLPAAYGS